MKKLLSFVLSFAVLGSMAVSALAQEPPREQKPQAGLSLGADPETEKNLGHLLTPGETYEFPIYITDAEGKTQQLQEEHLESYRLRVESKKGKDGLESIKAQEGRDGFVLAVETQPGWPTEQTGFDGALKMVKKTNGQTLYAADLQFTVGYGQIEDSALTGVKNGEYVYIEENAPVISEEQMKKLENYANGKKVTFTNGSWTYEVRLSDQAAVNMLNNQRTIRQVVEAFEDNNFKFVSFPAGPEFDFNGTVTIDISEEMDQFENFFLYRYYKGKLTKINAKINKDDETLSFETKKLGRFVVTDKEIADGTVVEAGFGGEGAAPGAPSKPNASKPNPQMGAGSVNGGAFAAGLLLAAAGIAAGAKKK